MKAIDIINTSTESLLKTTAEQIANNWKDNIMEAPTRQDYLYRMDAADLTLNREGDGRHDTMDLILDEPASHWVNVMPDRDELLTRIETLVTVIMKEWMAAQDDSWKKEVEAIY